MLIHLSICCVYLSLGATISFAQTDLGPIATIDHELLNKFILDEVNEYRKRAKEAPLENESLLYPAANDHANYMLAKEKVTHFQRSKLKKTPKNRVDFYGQQFATVGENVQLNNLNFGSTTKDKSHPLIHTYEELAEKLVLDWRNSPPHYANMISNHFLTTYTAISVSEDGEVYACQLFGGSVYYDEYKELNDTLQYKPDNPRKCRSCRTRPPIGSVTVLADSTIVFHYSIPKAKLHFSESRMRFYNPWSDGLAADIVLKSQYSCDSNSYSNGRTGVTGIPLKPVYKKDFGFIGLKNTSIVLGKVPDYIDEEFEVNLTVIQKKRTCLNIVYYIQPSLFSVEIPLDLGLNPADIPQTEFILDTVSVKLFFDKSITTLNDSSFVQVTKLIHQNAPIATEIELAGFASIEGSTENNIELFNRRTELLFDHLISLGIDSTKITTKSEENFSDFRQDIMNTEFEDWNQLSDTELKRRLQDKKLSDSLEFLLKHHRFVELRIQTRREVNRTFTGKDLLAQFQNNIDNGNVLKSMELQRVVFSLALSNEISTQEIANISIPVESKYIQLLHNQSVIKFYLDSLNPRRLDNFEQALRAILPLNIRDRRINTSLAIIEYQKGNWPTKKAKKDYFKEVKKRKYIDPIIKARILLSFSTQVDWKTYRQTGVMKQSKYFYNKAKKYIKPAKLTIDKTFEIASYYSFFQQNKYALDLTKSKIDETENPDDLIYFLKLIHLTDVKIPRKTYLRYFEKIRKYAGAQFCSYFNNPALNFQILDDEEIKEIYCKECAH